MGCAPTNRMRPTTPVADPKSFGSSVVQVREESEKENVRSIENIHHLGKDKQSQHNRKGGKMAGQVIDPFKEDIFVKEKRRGACFEKMNFGIKEHLQGYTKEE